VFYLSVRAHLSPHRRAQNVRRVNNGYFSRILTPSGHNFMHLQNERLLGVHLEHTLTDREAAYSALRSSDTRPDATFRYSRGEP